MRAHRFAAANCIEAFTRFGFHTHAANIDIQSLGEIVAHRIDVFTQLWSLKRDRRVRVDHLKSSLVREPNNASKQLQTVRIFPLLIRIRKVHAEITFAQRAENGIDPLRFTQQSASLPHIFLTGGEAELLRPAVNERAELWPEMTLEGIRLTAEAQP